MCPRNGKTMKSSIRCCKKCATDQANENVEFHWSFCVDITTEHDLYRPTSSPRKCISASTKCIFLLKIRHQYSKIEVCNAIGVFHAKSSAT